MARAKVKPSAKTEVVKHNKTDMHSYNGLSDWDFLAENSNVIFQEVRWIQEIIDTRITLDKDFKTRDDSFELIPNDYKSIDCIYTQFLTKFELNKYDRVLLVLALTSAFRPSAYDKLLEKIGNVRVKYPDFGGIADNINCQFVPTLQTAIFIIAGQNPELTGLLYNYYLRQSILFKEQIVILKHYTNELQRDINAVLHLAPEYLEHLTKGQHPRPDFNSEFPAHLITTSMEWNDLVVHPKTSAKLETVIDWALYGKSIIEEQGQQQKVKNGFPTLFFGPPGTGKTLAATLIGKQCNKEVYRVDISMVVSKYIGETEKNLSRLFDKAEHKDWILFFDEADSLFSKRSSVKDAHDKYANQEMSYLLQRMETFSGLTILATNYHDNLDEAMTRRFQSKIYFGIPEVNERQQLWANSVPKPFTFDPKINLHLLAHKFKITGANIGNIIKMCCIECKKLDTTTINAELLIDKIELEYIKEGKTF